MRKRHFSLIALAAASLLLTSCLSDDNDNTEYTYYKDTAISAFSLGTMNRYLHTTSSTGADSVYKVTYVGSKYKFTIDQIGHRIYNTDSMPNGTDLKHVIATITAVNNGLILMKSATSDSLRYYSNTDSLDFSTPRTVRIVAQDGQRYADYTVSVNARKVPEGTMAWTAKTTNAELAALDDIRALAAGTRLYAFGTEGGRTVGYATDITDGATWTKLPATFSPTATFVVKDKALYALDNGAVMTSADGQTWTTVATNSSLKRIVAASPAHLFALTADGNGVTTGMAASADNGVTWTADGIDDDAAMLPDDGVAYTCNALTTNDNIAQVMIVGRCTTANDIRARVWTKLDDYSSSPVKTSWNYVDNAGNDKYALGDIPSLAVTTYGGYPTAVVCSADSVSPMLQSRDGGLTWQEADRALPAQLKATVGKMAMTTDSEGSLWIIADGVVWKN